MPCDCRNWCSTERALLVIFGSVIGMFVFGGIVVSVLCKHNVINISITPGEWQQFPVSESGKNIYMHNAVSTDSTICSTLADYTMNIKKGNAIDAAVIAVLCVGVSNVHSAGIGGGSFMVIYDRSTKTAHSFDFRETAPASARADMYNNRPHNASLYGGLASGVPGQISGLIAAHKKFGRLPWSELVQPIVKLLREGQRVTIPLARAIANKNNKVPSDAPFAVLKQWLQNDNTGKPYVAGDLLKDEVLAQTLKKIEINPNDFYNGSLADAIVQEITQAGGIITKQDLMKYRTKINDPVTVQLKNGLTLHSLPPPSSGAVLGFILNILDSFGFGPEVKNSLEAYSLFLHRTVEAFKFAYAKRSALGDPQFVNVTELLANLTSESYADSVRRTVDDARTHDVNFYGPSFDWKEDSGTTHVSVVDSDGNAVSVTSTINYYFGSMIKGKKTGIIYNNAMNDFSVPNRTDNSRLPPSPSNFIEPGKRPMSSMSPVIITDASGNVQYVSGASGGPRITTAVAYNLARQIFLNETVKEAADAFRIHHQLHENYIEFNKKYSNIPEKVLKFLTERGHDIRDHFGMSVVNAIQRLPDGRLQANADFRKPSTTGGHR